VQHLIDLSARHHPKVRTHSSRTMIADYRIPGLTGKHRETQAGDPDYWSNGGAIPEYARAGESVPSCDYCDYRWAAAGDAHPIDVPPFIPEPDPRGTSASCWGGIVLGD
jgi:hypothetical protein